jgi:hypothetical protein
MKKLILPLMLGLAFAAAMPAHAAPAAKSVAFDRAAYASTTRSSSCPTA